MNFDIFSLRPLQLVAAGLFLLGKLTGIGAMVAVLFVGGPLALLGIIMYGLLIGSSVACCIMDWRTNKVPCPV